jgi:lipopolysaccharide transport system ATP-binding protein
MKSTDIAIRVSGLGKKYRISHRDEKANYLSLRESLIQSTHKLGQQALQIIAGQQQSAGMMHEDVWVLDEVNFEIKRGEIVGIIGKNGAGKSTLLKILTRITDLSRGRIEMSGRVASLLEVGTGFHPELTGRENIYLNGSIMGMSRAEIAGKFDAIVEFSGVEKFLDTPVKRYSSGMYVRLAFAVASHLESEILLIDEVLAVGDMEFQKKCLGRINEVANDGRTILFVSHSLPMVASLCSSCILLDSGRVVAQGNTSDVMMQYQTGTDINPSSINFMGGESPPGDMYVSLREAWIENSAGERAFSFSISEPIRIGISFVIRKSLLKAPQPNIHVKDSSGNYVFVSTPVESKINIGLDPGEHSVYCLIPANLLNDGMFSIGVALNHFQGGLTTAFFVQDGLSFNVVDRIEQNDIRNESGWSGRIPGLIRPQLEWIRAEG